MRKYFKYILVFFICGFIFSCTETTSEIKVYSIDGITKIWNKHKSEYIILYNYKNKTPQKRFDAILSYFRKYIRYDTIQKYKDGYNIFLYQKGHGLNKDYVESDIRYLSDHIEDYNDFYLFRISFYIKNGNVLIASDMLYTVPNNIKYKNIIEFPFNLDNEFIISKEDRIWKNLN